MPLVTMPDGQVVDLPDNPSPEQMEQLQGLIGPGALTRETGRVLGTAAQKGLASTPGMIGDVALTAMRKMGDFLSSAPAALSKPDLPVPPALKLLQIFGGLGQTEPVKATKFGDVTHALETVGGLVPEVPQPKTQAGKVAANVLTPAVAAVSGGGVGTFGQKATIGLAGGAGGEAAARLTDDNPLARVLGAFAGSGITALGQSYIPNSQKLVHQATEHMTDADWAKASALEKVLNAFNIPHTKSQLLGPRSTLDDVVSTASANPSVRPKLVTATEGATRQGNVPGKAEEAINVFTNQNLPPPGPANRAEVLSDIQEAAANKLRDIKNASNNAFTSAMPPRHIEYDQGRVRTLYNFLRQLADDPRFGKTTDEGKAILKLAEDLVEGRTTDLSRVHPVVLARAQKAAAAAGVAFDPSQVPGAREVTTFVTNAHKINNLNKDLKMLVTKDDYKGLPIADVRRILNQATPEFNPARDAKTAIMRDQYDPTAKSLTGQIAQMGGGVKPDKQTAKETALRLVFNSDQPQAAAIHQLGRDLGGQQVGELLREHISKTMQRILGQDQHSPQDFVIGLYQSPAQKENIDAALKVAAQAQGLNPQAVTVGFRRLMEALDSFKDLKMASGVSPATTAAQAGQNIVSQVATPLTGIRRFFDQRVTAKSYNKIADMVTSKDGLAQLQAISKTPKQESVRQMAISILTSSQETE